jgi:hypothetical protein
MSSDEVARLPNTYIALAVACLVAIRPAKYPQSTLTLVLIRRKGISNSFLNPLAILFFLAKHEKALSNSLVYRLTFFPQLANFLQHLANLRTSFHLASLQFPGPASSPALLRKLHPRPRVFAGLFDIFFPPSEEWNRLRASFLYSLI